MCSTETPYDILGISPNDSLETLKAKYKELARQNHPDKLHGLSEQDRKEREEYFKKVTVAYHTLWAHMKERTVKDAGSYGSHETGLQELMKQWHRVYENMSKVTDWGTIFKNTLHDVASILKRHTIHIPVRLIEIHELRKKKVRIFLREVEEPIFVDVDCSRFPSGFTTSHIDRHGYHHSIRIELFVEEKDMDCWIGDDHHVHENIYISWSEYVHGTEKIIPSFQGQQATIKIPPFAGEDYEIQMTGWGILGRDWIIHILCRPPLKEEWETERQKLL